MKLSVSAYRAHASAHKKILSSSYQSQLNYGSTAAAGSSSSSSAVPTGLFTMDNTEATSSTQQHQLHSTGTDTDNSAQQNVLSPTGTVISTSETQKDDEDDSSNAPSSDCKSPSQRTKSNQRWMKLRTTVQISSAIQKKPPLKREDSFLKRFSTRQIPETQETVEDTGSESASGEQDKTSKRRRRYLQKRRSVVNPDENFYFYWLMVLTFCILYNLWTLIVRQSFPELQEIATTFWFICDCISDIVFFFDIAVQLRTGYLEQGLMVYDDKKLACHYMRSREFLLDLAALIPLDLLQLRFGTQPLLRCPRFLKVYRSIKFYYIVESRTVWPNLWRVVNLIHILLILAHWFGCFYFLLSEAEGFQGDWVYPYRPGDYATLSRKYLGSLYWSTLTLTTIGDLPTPETNAEPSDSADGPRSLPRRGLKSRLLQFASIYGYIFTIVSYLIGVFIFATIVGQVGNVITNRNANRLEFERLLDGAKTYMRHHKVPGGMKRRVLRWYDYSWSRGRIQGGGDINTALGLLPDKLKTELALHVNLSVLKKVTIFQECQPEFLHDLVLKMKAYIFTPGDSICRKGEVAREMFIIADGILEVLSETGKVLTTMKAGDFFGEIGILNLDGLNKRTADVRSVGYSELFSLSREDVLAAMKDYPEAQEILQTLGRKRLMEVRCVNKKHAKAASEKAERMHQHNHGTIVGPGHMDNASENSASKRIVDKFRSDVRGIKSVLRKSRTNRRSDESLEMQPLHSSASSNASKSSKGVLRRMPRVRSDDFHNEIDDHHAGGTGAGVGAEIVVKDKTPSPIGAGLPLLHRLRLLKEKQDREERAVKTAPPIKSPTPNTHYATVSPQESIQEEPEQEIIGAGLPLFQRLQLLKAKEERLLRENQAKQSLAPLQAATTKTQAHSPTSPPPQAQLPTTSATKNPSTTSGSCSSSPSSILVSSTKPKVSFRDRIREMQQDTRTISEKEKDPSSTNLREKLIPTISAKFSSSKPSTSISLKEKIKNFGHSHQKAETSSSDSMKPWSKLKLATVVSSGSYSSLSNAQALESTSTQLNIMTPETKTADQQKTSQRKSSQDVGTKSSGDADKNAASMQTTSRVIAATTSSIHKVKLRPKPLNINQSGRKPKSYRSVDDLSPEYGGLPFVKKLKILNERQKLAELESAIQTRSFSLDCTESTSGTAATDLIMEPLYRSHSDASGISTSIIQRTRGNTNFLMATTFTTGTTSPIVPVAPLNIPQQCLRSPQSPNDLNETLERRQLKSILKKMSEENKKADALTEQGQSAYSDDKGLLAAPTVEGYVARHSKFMKSVTFNSTLSSPPSSANTNNNSMSMTDNGHTNISGAATDERLRFTFRTSSIESSKSGDDPDSCSIDTSAKMIAAPTSTPCSSPASLRDDSFQSDTYHNQKKLLKGTEESEYFSEVLLGIKHVIQTHMVDIHSKFQDRFTNLEMEVRRRDEIITKLQNKIQELEVQSSSGVGVATKSVISSLIVNRLNSPGTGSSGSSGELPFMRGDSIDTIFSSSPPILNLDKQTSSTGSAKSKTKRRVSPRHRVPKVHSWDESSDQESIECVHPLSSGYRGMMVSDLTGNMKRAADTVVLNIDDSTSSSSESSQSHLDDIEAAEQADQLHCDDWEVRMLAAELDRRESTKRSSILSSELLAGIDEKNALLRRRRKASETDTECSEIDVDLPLRPRAASLDQYNLRHEKCKGVFKALSFDRDKDRL